MVVLNSVDIIQYRSLLAGSPNALRALDMIEDCEGDLEDAAIALAIQAGQEPDRSERWLEGVAKRWRVFICQSDFQTMLTEETMATAIQTLATETALPAVLATPVVIYVLKTGVKEFCQPLGDIL
jgi:hypothetical protein